jgi:hypothetical protein
MTIGIDNQSFILYYCRCFAEGFIADEAGKGGTKISESLYTFLKKPGAIRQSTAR